MSSLSLTFQQNTSTVETAFTKINATIETLEKLSWRSKLRKLLLKGMSEDLMKYQDVVLESHSLLTGCDTRGTTRLKGAYDTHSDSIVEQAKEKITRLLAITISWMKNRFQSFHDNNSVISASRIIDVRLWPQNVESGDIWR